MMARATTVHLAWRRSPRVPHTVKGTLLLAAVALVVVAVQQAQLNRPSSVAPAPFGVDFANVLSRSAAVDHPANWPLTWPRASAPRSQRARAVRIGVLSADLARAAVSRNGSATWGAYYHTDPVAASNSALYSALVGAYTTDLITLVRGARDGGSAANELLVVREQSVHGATFGAELALARRLVRNIDPEYVALGEWLEVARLAATADDVDYFAQSGVRAFAVWVPQAPGLGDGPGTHYSGSDSSCREERRLIRHFETR